MNDNNSYKSQFAKYVSLNIIGMMGISFYILADTLFISRAMGSSGLAALNANLAVFSIMHGLGLMTGIGGAARYSILRGLGKKDEAAQVFMNSLYIGAVSAILLMTAGAFFSTEISLLLGANEETLAHSEVYMTAMLCFSPCFLLNNILLAFIRNDKGPRICMAAMLVSSLSNVFLDYIFIFIFRMDMYGAVFATGLSPVISMAVLTLHIRSKNNTIRLCRGKVNLDRMISLIKLGASSFITELSSAVTIIAFNLVMLKISGNTGSAAYGIVANTALVASSVFSGISQGVQPLASSAHGVGNKNGLARLLRYTAVTVISISLLIFAAVLAGAEAIASAFNSGNDQSLQEIASDGLRIYFAGFLFAGMNIVMSAFYSAVDSARKAFIISFLRSAAVLVPILILFSSFWGNTGVWISFVAAELAAFAATSANIISSRRIGDSR